MLLFNEVRFPLEDLLCSALIFVPSRTACIDFILIANQMGLFIQILILFFERLSLVIIILFTGER